MTELTYRRAIRIVREARGLTQGELAAAAGMSRQTVARIESGGEGRALEDLIRALEDESGTSILSEAEDLIREERADAARRRRAAARAAMCELCQLPLPRYAGRGRPRKRHRRCSS